jgi:hypothetical protein
MITAPEIVFTVTNDLTYDQRMLRICSTMAEAGYKVTLVGRLLPGSLPPDKRNFEQVRLKCRYNKGKLFYLEYNWKLYKYLHHHVKNSQNRAFMALCAIDLDTIMPVLRVSERIKTLRVYDAHELFTELTEVKRRPLVAHIWNWVERKAVPKFKFGYTVNDFIAGELTKRYQVSYAVIRNLPFSRKTTETFVGNNITIPPGRFFLYQGAVNEGRCFETLIPAMKFVNANLVIAGEGNFYRQARDLSVHHGVTDKVFFLGNVKPAQLAILTPLAYAGITLFKNSGLNQYYSLANRYFDYIQGGIPQLCVAYPEYEVLNLQYPTAMLIHDLSAESIAQSLNKLLDDAVFYRELQQHCPAAAKMLCWEKEAVKLLAYWNTILPIK